MSTIPPSDPKPGTIWVAGSCWHYVDNQGVRRAIRGRVALPGTHSIQRAREQFREAETLAYVDERGLLRRFGGEVIRPREDYPGADSGVVPWWVEGKDLHFVALDKIERKVVGERVISSLSEIVGPASS